jgi:acetyl-CoA carboxylase biotin carboxyl carrier protein
MHLKKPPKARSEIIVSGIGPPVTENHQGVSDMADIDVCSEIAGSVWKVEVIEGEEVEEDDTLVILESMKMEIGLLATADGVVKKILVKEGDQIAAGDVAVIITEG